MRIYQLIKTAIGTSYDASGLPEPETVESCVRACMRAGAGRYRICDSGGTLLSIRIPRPIVNLNDRLRLFREDRPAPTKGA